VRVKRGAATMVVAAPERRANAMPTVVAQAPTAEAVATPPVPTTAAQSTPETSAADAGLYMVKSPIVGTFFEAPSPGSPPFVKIGDTVEAGAVLCIVEAMKLMNEIESDIGGAVVSKLVSNGQPVEYGQPLFALRPK
jgi:acetyl-CoA carboxylase biotin carboxyl carrier protein